MFVLLGQGAQFTVVAALRLKECTSAAKATDFAP